MAFKLFHETRSLNHSIDYNSDGYRALNIAIKVRDRIMHPKIPEDIIVTDDEICDSLKSFIWINDNFDYMLENMVHNSEKALKESIEKLKEQIARRELTD